MTDRKSYVVATQRPWGKAVYDRVSEASKDLWACRFVEPPHEEQGQLLDLLEHTMPRYVFFLHWSDYIPPTIYERWECVNFHCTALPYGRGGHPIENLLLVGRKSTIMTAHRVVAELDAGPVYWQYGPVSLRARTKTEILDGFVEPCAELIRMIVSHDPPPRPQAGPVVRFSRLAPDAYARFWQERAR